MAFVPDEVRTLGLGCRGLDSQVLCLRHEIVLRAHPGRNLRMVQDAGSRPSTSRNVTYFQAFQGEGFRSWELEFGVRDARVLCLRNEVLPRAHAERHLCMILGSGPT